MLRRRPCRVFIRRRYVKLRSVYMLATFAAVAALLLICGAGFILSLVLSSVTVVIVRIAVL